MTTTQVQYWSYKEQGRHNLATELLGTKELGETIRHNRATETLGTNTLEENKRHNRATERLGTDSLKETTRHNKATEKETKRANKRRESLQQEQNTIAWFNAHTNRKVAEANIQKILKEASMSDAYKLLASRNKNAQKVGAVAVLTEMIADESQSPNTRAAAKKLLDELTTWAGAISDSGSSTQVINKAVTKVYETNDGHKMKLIYKGGSWFFVPAKSK